VHFVVKQRVGVDGGRGRRGVGDTIYAATEGGLSVTSGGNGGNGGLFGRGGAGGNGGTPGGTNGTNGTSGWL